jgi:hypothetical protein
MLRLLGAKRGGRSRTPREGNPGRGIHKDDGKWGPNVAAPGEALVDTIRVPRRSGDRVGIGGAAREYARYKRERDVYRVCGHAVGGSGIYGTIETRPADASGLFCEADRTRARNGCDGGRGGNRKPAAVSKTSFHTFSGEFLSFRVAPYTIRREEEKKGRGSRTRADAWFCAVENGCEGSGGLG